MENQCPPLPLLTGFRAVFGRFSGGFRAVFGWEPMFPIKLKLKFYNKLIIPCFRRYNSQSFKFNMSRNNNQSVSNSNGRTPHCKVCMDAGKSRTEYESHYVKTREGVVCCPTLLAQQYRYCKLPGKSGNHTVKYCPTLIKQQSADKYAQILANKSPKIAKKTPIKALTANIFAAAFDESDTDTDTDTDTLEFRPASPLTSPPNESYKLWAKFNINAGVPAHTTPEIVVPEYIPTYTVKNMQKNLKKRIINWADVDSDSDNDALN